jgi:uncharacterized membrane protein YqaE (UPF0057 family)
MKTIFTRGIMAIAITALVSSCSTSNDVASNRGIQKRKYNKGFFVSKSAKKIDKKNQTENTKQVVVKEEMAEIINIQPNISKEVKTTETISLETNNNIAVENNSISPNNTQSNYKEKKSNNNNNVSEVIENNTDENKTITKKGLKKQLKQNKKKSVGLSSSDVDLIILILLAFLLPPLAVYLYEGVTTRFWISLILTLLFLTWFFATVFALLIVTGTI